MPVLERIVHPKGNRVMIEVPKEYSRCVCKVILFTIEEEKKPKCDFSDLVGKLHWQGDAVKEQRKMRDEL